MVTAYECRVLISGLQSMTARDGVRLNGILTECISQLLQSSSFHSCLQSKAFSFITKAMTNTNPGSKSACTTVGLGLPMMLRTQRLTRRNDATNNCTF